MEEIIIKTQKEYDKIKDDFEGEIKIIGNLERIYRKFEKAIVSIHGSAVINNVSDSAVINSVYGSAKLLLVTGLASILFVSNNAYVKTQGNNIVRYYKNEKNIKLDLSKETTVIKLDKEIKNIEWYCKNYPVKHTKTKVIMYKTVHKVNEEYISNNDKNFKYEIGKIKTDILDPIEKGSCSSGIHISHKYWALNFGKDWDDVALLECEVNKKDIVVCEDCDGKVRTSKVKVLREVPKEEYYN